MENIGGHGAQGSGSQITHDHKQMLLNGGSMRKMTGARKETTRTLLVKRWRAASLVQGEKYEQSHHIFGGTVTAIDVTRREDLKRFRGGSWTTMISEVDLARQGEDLPQVVSRLREGAIKWKGSGCILKGSAPRTRRQKFSDDQPWRNMGDFVCGTGMKSPRTRGT